jgi:hypothetical protein
VCARVFGGGYCYGLPWEFYGSSIFIEEYHAFLFLFLTLDPCNCVFLIYST